LENVFVKQPQTTYFFQKFLNFHLLQKTCAQGLRNLVRRNQTTTMNKKRTLLFNTAIFTICTIFFTGFMESCSKQNQAASATPTISSFTPASGSRGEFVKVDGTNFSTTAADNHVFFNGVPAIISSASPNSLVVVVPDSAGSGKISVESNGNKESSGSNFNYVAAVSVLAGDGQFGSRDGQGKNAEFFSPFGAGLDAEGNIFVADQSNNLIRKITPGGLVTTMAGTGRQGFADGKSLEAQFSMPTDVASDASGNLYVTDANRIRKISADGNVSTLAGNETAAFADGSGDVARFNSPAGITVDASGNIFVADVGNNRIRKISPAGSVTTVAGTGIQGYLDGAATDAQFNSPFGIAVDASGDIFISDFGNLRIRKISSAGSVSTLAGDGKTGYKDGDPGIAEFGSTLGISVDASGNVFVADGDNNVFRKITPSGTVSTFAGDGKVGGNEAPVSLAEFHIPADILAAPNGIFYVTDVLNNRICKIF
jgi:sugar lactone lactonase YvrE